MSSHSIRSFTAALWAAVFFVFTPAVFAQVQVVESPAIRGPGQVSNTPPSSTAASSEQLVDLYYQIQALQQQVQVLTGMVEEANYELKRMKQQQLDDYVDLDRRVSELTQSGIPTPATGRPTTLPANPNTTPAVSTGTTTPITTAPAASPADEFASYNEATKFVREREWEKAVSAYQAHIQRFPNGRYVPNSHYWLGEVYLVQSELAMARDAFNRVVVDHPDHAKAVDAKFKLGQVYFRMGDPATARPYFEAVAATDSNVARLAQNFLRDNY